MIRRPPRSTLFPTRRSSDLLREVELAADAEALGRIDRYDYAQALLAVAGGGLAHREANGMAFTRTALRSEEHTSELQSQFHLVCRLLLEKKKKNTIIMTTQK